MVETKKRVFYRRTIKFGNSAGVLLPKALLDADVRVTVINRPRNIKKDVIAILTPILEQILGIYLISAEKDKVEILTISTKINKHIEKGCYVIDISPLQHIKNSLKEKPEIKEKLSKAKTIINKKLILDLKKEFKF